MTLAYYAKLIAKDSQEKLTTHKGRRCYANGGQGQWGWRSSMKERRRREQFSLARATPQKADSGEAWKEQQFDKGADRPLAYKAEGFGF